MAGDILGTQTGRARTADLASRDLEVRTIQPVLAQSRPNPFSGRTTIRLSLPAAGDARLQVFDARGRLVRVLAGGFHAEGEHEYQWDGRSDDGLRVPAGVYFYRLQARDVLETRRMVLLPQ